MPDILTKQVDLGFDATKRDATELPRGSAADGSKNVLYSRGTIKTPYGFSKVESGSLPLDSGNSVLLTGTFSELDKSQHFLAVTKDKIYERDTENSEWDDITQSGVALQGNIYNPMSMASILHTDGLALNGSGDDWYHHCLVCTGVSPIQRWAGKFETDFADLVGADGYHDTDSGVTTHYALQVGVFNERAILISPKIADSNGNLVENNQVILWPQAGKLETWTGTGSGSTKLLETGGYNIWGAQLGNQWIQYQNNSIWSLTHVGGTRIFEIDVEFPDLGLLAPHLLYSKNNVHYFIGNDFNVYAYYGGSNIKNIGRNIQSYLQRDLDPEYAYRSWICMGAENSRLWIFIVPNGETYVTEGYGIDMQTGAWMKRDFLHKWPTGTGGITSVSLIGASSYYAGSSYREAIESTKCPSKNVAISGAVRSSNVVTVTTDIAHAFIVGETVTLADCDSGGETDAFDGDHEIASKPSTTTFTFAQAGADENNLAAGTATVDKAMTYQDAVNITTTYRQALQETLTEERMVLGDSAGYVYQYNDTVSKDDTVNIPARHITEVYDLGVPSKNKLWPGIRITAKGTGIGTGGVIVSYRTGNFETTDIGWIDIGSNIPLHIAQWKMNDDAASATVLDTTGNYNGTYKDKDGDLNTSTGASTGLIGGALDFDGAVVYGGSDEHVDCGNPFESVFQGSFSISLWALQTRRPIATSKWLFGMSTINPLENDCVWIISAANGTIYTQYTSNNNRARFIPSNVVFPDGQATEWVHIVMVHDHTVRGLYGLTAYLNSVLGTTTHDMFRGNTADVVSADFRSTVNPLIGAENVGNYGYDNEWCGLIDDVRLFNVALKKRETTALYNSGNGREDRISGERALTSEFTDYEFTVWDTSKKIQFRFTNADGDDFVISNYELIEPMVQG